MEAQEYFVLQFHLSLFLERENGPFRVLIPFLSLFSKVFFWFTNLVKCKCYAYDDNDMIKCLMTLLQKWDVTTFHRLKLLF